MTDPLHIEILGKDKPAAVDDVHLYILNETSSFFLMLQAVWKAYLLVRFFLICRVSFSLIYGVVFHWFVKNRTNLFLTSTV